MTKSRLHSIKNSGFKTPKDYFNSFESNLLNELKLKEIVTKSGFNTPNNYFEDFNTTLNEKLQQEQKQVKVVRLFNKQAIRYISGIAATVILCFGIYSIIKLPISLSSIDTQLVENYLLEQDLNTDDLADLYVDTENNISVFEDLNDTNLENYLLENTNEADFYID